jgi:beta-lactamase family protein
MVPGKLPLYLEGENPEIASETAANVGVELSARNARLVYIPGAAAVTAAMTQRIKGADVVFFDALYRRASPAMTARLPGSGHSRPRSFGTSCRSP